MRYALSVLLLFCGPSSAQQRPATPARIELAGVSGRIDHLSADVKGQRLFVSALGNNSLEVIDVRTGKRIRSIGGLAEPQGVYYDAGSNRVFVACAKDGAVKVYDADTFGLLGTAPFGDDADNLRYDARQHRIVAGYGSGALGFLDSDGKKTGEIPLDAHPESFQLERAGTRVFVNVPERKEIEVADLAANKVVAKWPVTGAARNFPMALDEVHHRLLIGCRAPARMLAIDTRTGRQTASAEIAGDTDDLFYDANRGRVYVVGGEGFVDVFEQRDPDRYERIARYPTAPGARTGLFVPDWDKLFVAVPKRGGQHAHVLAFAVR